MFCVRYKWHETDRWNEIGFDVKEEALDEVARLNDLETPPVEIQFAEKGIFDEWIEK